MSLNFFANVSVRLIHSICGSPNPEVCAIETAAFLLLPGLFSSLQERLDRQSLKEFLTEVNYSVRPSTLLLRKALQFKADQLQRAAEEAEVGDDQFFDATKTENEIPKMPKRSESAPFPGKGDGRMVANQP